MVMFRGRVQTLPQRRLNYSHVRTVLFDGGRGNGKLPYSICVVSFPIILVLGCVSLAAFEASGLLGDWGDVLYSTAWYMLPVSLLHSLVKQHIDVMSMVDNDGAAIIAYWRRRCSWLEIMRSDTSRVGWMTHIRFPTVT